MAKKQLTVLVILDGFGVAPAGESNAISRARMPFYQSLLKQYSHTTLQASGKYVGLPAGQSGNSEAGHMNIGAGRIVEQDAVVISKSINDGTFFRNPAFLGAVNHAKKYHSNVHLIGLLTGNQSAHADPDHLISLITLLKHHNIDNVFLHLFTDGRDSPRFFAQKLYQKHAGFFNKYAKISTMMGRFYGMDRKKEWSRTAKAYNAMVFGTGLIETDPREAIFQAYARNESDEFIQPTVIVSNAKKPVGLIKDGDSVIFFNLRSDRARQMCKPFVQENFEQANAGGFKRKKVLKNMFYVAMTDFGPDLGRMVTAYPSRDVIDALPVALKDYRQLAIAENEKYAHVTYFFNGGFADPIAGETRLIIASPNVREYDQKPEMSLALMTETVIKSIRARRYDFIVMNIANPDMIAHTGNLQATIKACEYVDQALKKLVKVVLDQQGIVIVTGDHGNAEGLIDHNNGWPDTEHSTSPVPFIIVRQGAKLALKSGGVLGDIAPTILDLLHQPKPKVMTGKSLIKKHQ